MALANVACLLARYTTQEQPVLVLDWDLEAPGLHRYFASAIDETQCATAPGVIELFSALSDGIRDSGDTSDVVRHFDIHDYVLDTGIPGVRLMKAGALDAGYPERVTAFDWFGLFKRAPGLFATVAEILANQFAYVLIDSRTGYTDVGGVCTALMPERLVAVFTPNRQSLLGLKQVMRQAVEYRRQSTDDRPLIVFPLPCRIETAEPELRRRWRYGDEAKALGYQPTFEALFRELYGLESCELEAYFDEVQIQHVPRFAYGEDVAVMTEGGGERLSLTRSFEAFTERLMALSVPWEPWTRAAAATVDSQRTTATAEKLALTLAREAARRMADGEFEPAAELLQQLVVMRREGGGSQHVMLAETLAQLAEALMALDRNHEALAALTEADAVYTARADVDGRVKTLQLLGRCLETMGDVGRAREVAQERVALCRRATQAGKGSPLAFAEALRDFADIEGRLGRLDEAARLHDEAESVVRRAVEEELARARLSAGVDDLHKIMETANAGIGSTQQYRELPQRLLDLDSRLGPAEQEHANDNVVADTRALREAIAQNLDLLHEFEHDIAVRDLGQQFESKMSWFKEKPIDNPRELADALEFFRNLHAAATQLRSQVTDGDRQALLQSMLEALDDVLRRLDVPRGG